MIQFLNVSGQCMIDDGLQCRDAYPGMSMPIPQKTCIIYTGPLSHAVIDIRGARMTLPADSIMTAWPPRPPVPLLKKISRNLKHYTGVIWSWVDQGQHEKYTGNAAVGVRG